MSYLVTLLLLVLTCGWSISFGNSLHSNESQPSEQLSIYRVPDTLKVIQELMDSMSLKAKVGQMIIVYHAPESFLKKHDIGGTIIMQNMLKKPDQLAQEIQSIQDNFPIGIFTSIDQEGGYVNRLKRLPGYAQTPSASEFALLDQQSQIMWVDSFAQGMHRMGLNLNLAPVLDPSHNGQGKKTLMGVKGRAFAKNHPDIVKHSTTFCNQLKKRGISSTAKHFPGYDVSSNSDHEIAKSGAPEFDILRRAKVFNELNHCTPFIMMSSIEYPKYDNVPSVFSFKMVALAKEMAPHALIMTDDLWGAALRHYINPKAGRKYPNSSFKRLAQMAFLAGNDLFMITYPQKAIVIQQGIKSLITRFPNLEHQLNQSVRKILLQKARMGLIKKLGQ